MTKAASILLTKRHSLAALPEQERQVIRHVLLDAIGGLNEQHQQRWFRWVNRVLKAEPGETFELLHLTERSGAFHRMHMAMEQRLFERQDYFPTLKALRLWLKTGAMWGTFQRSAAGRLGFVPASTSYEECSDDEMREVHTDMVAFLRSAHALRRLWPHLKADKRAEMLESILADEREEGRQ